MSNIKRFKDFVNENIENNTYIADIFNEYGKDPSEADVAIYCYNNFEDITDYPKEEMDGDDIEEEILEIGQALKLDYNKFRAAWKTLVGDED